MSQPRKSFSFPETPPISGQPGRGRDWGSGALLLGLVLLGVGEGLNDSGSTNLKDIWPRSGIVTKQGVNWGDPLSLPKARGKGGAPPYTVPEVRQFWEKEGMEFVSTNQFNLKHMRWHKRILIAERQ